VRKPLELRQSMACHRIAPWGACDPMVSLLTSFECEAEHSAAIQQSMGRQRSEEHISETLCSTYTQRRRQRNIA